MEMASERSANQAPQCVDQEGISSLPPGGKIARYSQAVLAYAWPVRSGYDVVQIPLTAGFFSILALIACGCSKQEGIDASVRVIAQNVGQPPSIAKQEANHDLTSRGYQANTHSVPAMQIRVCSSESPTPARVFSSCKLSLSGCCHILQYYGLGPTDLASCASGELALKALTDEQAAIATFGKSPFIRTRNGLRYLLSNDPVFHTEIGEVHRDQCLATFAALGVPLETPISLESGPFSIADLLSESMANFNFGQKELAWSALVYAKYLPPKKEWVSRFGEKTSFSQLVDCLVHRDLNQESCAGTHVFQALVQLDAADHRSSILDDKSREELKSFLDIAIREAVQRQHSDGSWDQNWCSVLGNPGPTTTFRQSFLVTGHMIEVLLLLDPKRNPDREVYVRAAKWLEQSMDSKEINQDGSWVCPFTHAARAVREILVRPLE